MHTLYEVRNGYVGESYVRCYVWTQHGEARAKELAAERFREDAHGVHHSEDYWTGLRAEVLFSADAREFATDTTDGGWSMPLPLSLAGE